MNFFAVFILAMLSVSAVIWVLSAGLKLIDQRVEQWPLLWATALWLCVTIPVLGFLLSLLPNAGSHESLAAFSLHEPLQSLGLMVETSVDVNPKTQGFGFVQVKLGLVAVYLVGVFWSLMKLAWGRMRLYRLILKADCADIAGQDDVLISVDVHSPFAWTPFGQHQHSRILLPQSYRGVVSSEQIQDILLHERAHIARRDDECGLIMRILLCLCWISPFARSFFAGWNQATEIRCDMAVTAHRDPKMRKAYADTLVQALHIVAGRVQQYPAASFSTQRIRNEKMRIKHIMSGTQPAFKRRRDKLFLSFSASALTVLGAFAISATSMAQPTEKSSNPPVGTTTPGTPKKAETVKRVTSAIVTGRLTSKYGPAPDPFKAGKTRNHFGVDIAAATGTPIYAPADGVIRAATDAYNGNPKYGNVVALETEGGVLTMFAHLEGYIVVSGQRVTKGAQIATVGNSGKSTGPHVHIETRKNGRRVDPQSIWDIGIK